MTIELPYSNVMQESCGMCSSPEWCVGLNKCSDATYLYTETQMLAFYEAGIKAGLEKAAKDADSMKPPGGRAWTQEQAACFDALEHLTRHLRALAEDSKA